MRYIVALAFLILTSGVFAVEAGTIDRMSQDQTLRIGHRTDAAPFSLVNDTGKPTGFTVELCEAVAADIKRQLSLPALQLVYVPVTVADRFDAVADGKIDLECGSTTMTLGRRERVDFSLPIYVTGASLVVRTGAEDNFQDLAGKRLAVVKATTTEAVLADILRTLKIDAQVIPVGSYEEGFAKLEAGDVVALFGDRPILADRLAKRPGNERFRLSNLLFSAEQYALMLPRGDSEFRLLVDRALSRTYRSGDLATIYRNWFGQRPPSDLLALFYQMNSLPEN